MHGETVKNEQLSYSAQLPSTLTFLYSRKAVM